ncbi:transcriptional regulator [Paraburkholderia steynii]|uniref:Transcriptional regulator n=1 Tax=Paraburkholderia steynii TaxID=1245441 RepID=A0A4V2NHD3_9BURK|nr:transcriptional regulator [Paraburkholderia steynii]
MSPTNETTDDDASASIEGLLTAKDLAKRLGLTLATIKRYASQPGKLPPRVTWTRLQRWHPQAVDEWEKAQAGLMTIDEQVRRAREAGTAKAAARGRNAQSPRRKPLLGRQRGSGKPRSPA